AGGGGAMSARAVQAAPDLVRGDGGIAGRARAGAQCERREEAEAAHERLVADLPAEAGRREERPRVPRCQATRAVVAAGEREEVAVLEGVVDAAHVRGQLPHAERAARRLRILTGAEVVPEL